MVGLSALDIWPITDNGFERNFIQVRCTKVLYDKDLVLAVDFLGTASLVETRKSELPQFEIGKNEGCSNY